MGTARFLRVTIVRELGKAVARWLAGALVVFAVFFGPNGVDPHDIVHHMRASAWVTLVVASLAAIWIAPSVRRAMIAPGSDVLRALPYHRGVLGGALFLGVLVAAAPFGVLVVAGGGPGLSFACALIALVAVLQPRAPSSLHVLTWARGGARIAFAAGSLVACFRVPIATTAVAAPFGAWALAAAFRDARADRGASMRLVVAGPRVIAVPWSVVVQGARSDGGAMLRALALVVFAALLARVSLPRFDEPMLPATASAIAAATLGAPALVLSWARSARAHRALPLVVRESGVLARRAVLVFAVVPFWAFLIALRSLSAGLVAAATFAGFALVLAADPGLATHPKSDERLPLASALLAAIAAVACVLAPWAPACVLVLAFALRIALHRRSS
ncbi:hypothetical protein BH09MYX1_BH09MYX1_21030 [soil metagenome]